MAINPNILKGWGPGGWNYFQPETNWHAPGPLENNFDKQVKNIIAMRAANPRFGLSVDPAAVAADLEAYTELRWSKIYSRKGMDKFLVPTPASEEAKKKESRFISSAKKLLVETAALVGVDAAPIEDWLGAGGVTVAPDHALQRALICEPCRGNKVQSWFNLLTVQAAGKIRSYLARKNEMKLETPIDAKLGLCTACKCCLTLKIWCPVEHIDATMTPAVKDKLFHTNDKCWALQEIYKLRDDRKAALTNSL